MGAISLLFNCRSRVHGTSSGLLSRYLKFIAKQRSQLGNGFVISRLSRRAFYSAILSGDEPEDLSISSHRKFSSKTANATSQSPKEQSGRHSEELPVVGKKQ